jgi:hypothetical protein
MSVWNFITAEQLIELSQNGNYGLGPRRWREQLESIRRLPEVEPPEEKAA